MTLKVMFVRGQKLFLLNSGIGIAQFMERRELIYNNRREKRGRINLRGLEREYKMSDPFSRVFLFHVLIFSSPVVYIQSQASADTRMKERALLFFFF